MAVLNSERRCKASSSEFKEIWPGLKRCMVCGFALATDEGKEKSNEGEKTVKYPKEDTLHSTYHGKFYKAKSQYGYSNVLDYKTLKQKEESLPDFLIQIKKNDISSDVDSFSDFFADVTSMIKEIRKWADSFKNDKSLTVQNLYDGLRTDINEIRALCRKGKDTVDISNLMDIAQSILPHYHNVFDTVESVQMVKSSGVVKDYDTIPMPEFSFDIKEKGYDLEKFMQIIPAKQSRVDAILNDLYTVEYTRSLRLWDMCKPHPRFEHFAILLWNTPKFLAFIKPYMTEYQYNTYVDKNKANRQLVDFKFKEAPFYFGRVSLSEICEEKMNESACTGDCANCPFGFTDLSYMEKLIESSDDDDDVSDGYENTAEYKQFAQVMTTLGQMAR